MLEQSHLQQIERRNSLNIILVGNTGSGKSSLTNCLVGPVAENKPIAKPGWRPVTKKLEKYEIPIKDSKDAFVYVYNLQSMFHSMSEDNEEELIGKMCTNDANSVLIVCIPMHNRFDESTLMTLQYKFGKQHIWQYTVIALTKADQYPSVWKDSIKWWERSAPILEKKFNEALSECREYLKEMFTQAKNERSRPWMTEEEFDDIPIIPTSKLTRDALFKMEDVRHQFWFEELLIKCCERVPGTAMINIHSERLAALSEETIQKVSNSLHKSTNAIPTKIRNVFGATKAGSIVDFTMTKLYQDFIYSPINSPRFEFYQTNNL